MAALASAGRDYGEPYVLLDSTAVSSTHFVQLKKTQMESNSQVSKVLITCAQNSQLSQCLRTNHTPTKPRPSIRTESKNASSLHSVLEDKQLEGHWRGGHRVFQAGTLQIQDQQPLKR